VPIGLLVVALGLFIAGCTFVRGGGPSPERTGSPLKAADCNHMRRGGDPGLFAGFDWSPGRHAYGQPVTLYVCVDPRTAGSAVLQVPEGVTTSPDRRTDMALGGGVLPFVVTVRPGATGRLRMVLANQAGNVRARRAEDQPAG